MKTWIIEPQISYNRGIGDGVLEGLAGTTFQENNQYSLAESGFGFSSDALITNIAAASQVAINSPLLNALYKYNAFICENRLCVARQIFGEPNWKERWKQPVWTRKAIRKFWARPE